MEKLKKVLPGLASLFSFSRPSQLEESEKDDFCGELPDEEVKTMPVSVIVSQR